MTAKTVSVTVTLGPEAAKTVDSTLAKLKSLGLRDVTLLRAIGTVSGRVVPEKLGALRQLPGVTVELDETITIPPPDSPLQ